VDRRAQGCAQWRVFHADARRVSALRARAGHFPLPDSDDLSRVRIDVEGYVRGRAARAVVVGLLAAGQKSEIRSQRSEIRNSDLAIARSGENSVAGAVGGRFGGNRIRSDRHDGFAGAVAALAPPQKRRSHISAKHSGPLTWRYSIRIRTIN